MARVSVAFGCSPSPPNLVLRTNFPKVSVIMSFLSWHISRSCLLEVLVFLDGLEVARFVCPIRFLSPFARVPLSLPAGELILPFFCVFGEVLRFCGDLEVCVAFRTSPPRRLFSFPLWRRYFPRDRFSPFFVFFLAILVLGTRFFYRFCVDLTSLFLR